MKEKVINSIAILVDFSLGIGYTVQGKQQVSSLVRAECFSQKVSALIMPE